MVEKFTGFYKKDKTVISKILLSVYTLFFVLMGWVLFRAESVSNAVSYMGNMFGFGADGFLDALFLQNLKQVGFWLIFGVLFSTPFVKNLGKKLPQNNIVLNLLYCVAVVLLFIVSTASIVCSSYNPFIYFNF